MNDGASTPDRHPLGPRKQASVVFHAFPVLCYVQIYLFARTTLGRCHANK
jgi:hypothetical protein